MTIEEVVKCENKYEYEWLYSRRVWCTFIIVAILFKLIGPLIEVFYHKEYKEYFASVTEYTYDLLDIEHSSDLIEGCYTAFEVYLSGQWELYMPYYSYYLNVKEVTTLEEMKDMYYGIINSADNKNIPEVYKYMVHNHALCICRQAMRPNVELQEKGVAWMEEQYPRCNITDEDLFKLEPIGFVYTWLSDNVVSMFYWMIYLIVLLLTSTCIYHRHKKLSMIIEKGYYIL